MEQRTSDYTQVSLQVRGSHRSTIRHYRSLAILGVIAALASAGSLAAAAPIAASQSPKAAIQQENYGALPLRFEVNQGQTAAAVKYLSRGPGYALFLTSHSAVLRLQPADRSSERGALPEAAPHSTADSSGRSSVLRMTLLHTSANLRMEGLERLPGVTNYLIGKSQREWRRGIVSYGKVRYRSIYPGVDLIYYGTGKQLEYDFVAAPGADPGQVRLLLQGLSDRLEPAARVTDAGDLVTRVDGREVIWRRPVAYQESHGQRQPVACRYEVSGGKPGVRVGFRLGSYNHQLPLVIDPILSYATYLGGTGDDRGYGIAVDTAGNAYITGYAGSTDFPTTAGVVQPASGGGLRDAFIAKLNPAGSALVYSTYLGGSGDDRGIGITINGSGAAYVTGTTNSANFPTTAGAAYTTLKGGYDAFVTELTADGSGLVYSTLLGGSADESGARVALDASGNAYVCGVTASTDFPVTPGAVQTTYGGFAFDAFVTKLNPTGTALVYSTFLGGNFSDAASGIAVDSTGAAWVVGQTHSDNFPVTAGAFRTTRQGSYDGFISKLNVSGTGLLYSTYFGSTFPDACDAVAIDGTDNVYVTGYMFMSSLPGTPGAFQTGPSGGNDAFVTKFTSTGTLVYLTYLGGSGDEQGNGIAVDSTGSVYVAGQTTSGNFPTAGGPYKATHSPDSGANDAFLAHLDATGSTLLYSTYLGGCGDDIAYDLAIDSAGSSYLVGTTLSADFPVTLGSVQPTYRGSQQAFVAKISPGSIPAPVITSFTPTSGTVGTRVTITGANFGGTNLVEFACTRASFRVDSSTQITAIVPVGASPGPISVATAGGFTTSATNFTPTVPSITNFNPTSGPVGAQVTINGSGFSGASAVRFNGVNASFVVNSDSQIVATVPVGASSGPISVDTPAGTVTSSQSFTVSAPTVTGFSPTSGPVGTQVTITGTNFLGATMVRFGGIQASYSVNSSTQIVAVVPQGLASGAISVTTPAGTGTSAGTFTVNPPSVTGLAPTSGPVGTSVMISGTGFTGATAVQFHGVAANYTVNSDTSITATVPAGASTGVVTVTTPAGSASSAGNFTVTPPALSVTGFSPASGGVGTNVMITGVGFTGTTGVSFNGVGATYSVVDDTHITAIVPQGASSGPIRVTTPAGSASSATNFTVNPPVVSGFSPTSGSPGASVSVTGTGFLGATAVTFNGTHANYVVNSDTSITAFVPAGASTGPIAVTTPAGSGASSTNFSVLP